MTWSELDWKILDRLREGFLGGAAAQGPYWKSEDDLAHYDLTYAERIGWKWDAVIRELRLRGWAPRGGTILDWGCGSGVASRRAIGAFGAAHFDSLLLWDHSSLAIDYAENAATRAFPGLNIGSVTPGYLASGGPIGLLVLSHVLNELSTGALAQLRLLILRSEAVLWVEAGTREVARGLQVIRDELRDTFAVIAPCTHALPCGLLAPGNERHWCHFFAAPPSEIFANPGWVKFGQRAGIDLRSLPYAFLAMEKKEAHAARNFPPATDGLSRVIGRPAHFKPYARLLNCDSSGIAELTLLKRDDPALYKELDRTKAPLVYRWKREANFIRSGSAGHGSAAK
ncbi:MAG: small ribosomal subunit Rsm22 family protein [Opitutaceae bacterium]|jgi:hypothetical protein